MASVANGPHRSSSISGFLVKAQYTFELGQYGAKLLIPAIQY